MPAQSSLLQPSRSVQFALGEKTEGKKELRTVDSMDSMDLPSNTSSEVDLGDYEVAPLENKEEIMKIVETSVYEMAPEYQQRLMSHWETVNPEQFMFYNRKSKLSKLVLRSMRRSRSTMQIPSEISDVFRDEHSMLSIKSSVMTVASEFVLQSTALQHRNTEILHKPLQRVSYEFVRDIAVKKVSRNVIHKLNFIRTLSSCFKEDPDMTYDYKRVFSWDEGHFQSRRNVSGTFWVEILLKQFSPECLNLLKLKRDVEEIHRFMNMLFEAFDRDTQDEQIVENAVKSVERAHAFLNISTAIERQYKAKMRLLTEKIKKLTEIDSTRFSEWRLEAQKHFQEKISSYSVILPIKFRYKIKYNETKREEYEHDIQSKETKLEDTINEYKSKIQIETYCFQCIMNTYYTDIEQLKDRINYINGKYEEDFYTVENANQYLKINLSKTKMRKRFLTEELERLREQVAEIEMMDELKKSGYGTLRQHGQSSHRMQTSVRGLL